MEVFARIFALHKRRKPAKLFYFSFIFDFFLHRQDLLQPFPHLPASLNEKDSPPYTASFSSPLNKKLSKKIKKAQKPPNSHHPKRKKLKKSSKRITRRSLCLPTTSTLP